MTKSPRAVAQQALRLAQEALPAYSSKFSRKDFTQPQLFALLTLKTFFKEDDHIRLQPANPQFDPIRVKFCQVQGIVKGVVRRYGR